MKKCPYCAEEIQDDAVKCKHCGEFLKVPDSYHDQGLSHSARAPDSDTRSGKDTEPPGWIADPNADSPDCVSHSGNDQNKDSQKSITHATTRFFDEDVDEEPTISSKEENIYFDKEGKTYFDSDSCLVGRYFLLQEIRRCGGAVIRLAYDGVLKTKVVVKTVLLEDCIGTLKTEAQIMMKLGHPGILAFRDFVKSRDVVFLIMEYFDGKYLDDILAEKGKCTVDETRDIARQILEALTHIHSRRILHLDVKPENILIGEKEDKTERAEQALAKLTGFACAREMKDVMTRQTDRLVSGTLLYMSPEQIKCDKLGAHTDIYCFGATLYELVTGHPPFHTGDITYQHINVKPDDPKNFASDLSDEMNSIIMRCLEKNPAQRFASAGEIEKLL